MELPKPRNWSPAAYLSVAVVLTFFTLVAWPLLRNLGEQKLAAGHGDDGGKVARADPPVPKPRSEEERPAAPEKRANPGKGGPGPAGADEPKVGRGDSKVAPPADPPRPAPARFRDVAIEEPFDAVFAGSKTLMDTPQVREVVLPGGSPALVCVVQAKLRDDTPAGRVDAEKVCAAKMAAALLAWKQGLDAARADELDAATERVDGKVVTAMKGHVRTLPPVGRWASAGGDVYYMAFGKVFGAGELKP